MIRAVVFLQNAWSPMYAGGTWPRESWLRALGTSRSGQRLAILKGSANACDSRIDFWYDNVTPIVGATPDSIVPADRDHVRKVLREQQPDYVVSCGKHAERAVDAVLSDTLAIASHLNVPHPARRVLTNQLYWLAGRELVRGFSGKTAFYQQRGKIERAHWSHGSAVSEPCQFFEVRKDYESVEAGA